MLEIDHIVAKSKWGSDAVDNLLTTCFECNRGKWSSDIKKTWKEIYKTKIQDNLLAIRKMFYKERNKRFMGNIDEKTFKLLCIYINEQAWWDAYQWFIGEYLLFASGSLNLHPTKEQFQEAEKLFLTGWKVCDDILDVIAGDVIHQDLIPTIDEVFDSDNRTRTSDEDYTGKLNYKLTSIMSEREWYNPILYKFSLYHKLIK